MKKTLFIILLFSFASQAQETDLEAKKNEFRFDVLSVIITSKTSISYEYFLINNYSFGVNVNYSNSKKLNDDFDDGYRNNVPKYEINPYLRYRLSEGKSRYYFAEVFSSINGGDFREIVRLVDDSGNAYYTTQKSIYNDVALGGSLGYKMYFKESLALEFLVGFGSNLINKEKSPDVISRVGLNLGYRF
jgi:hypothetical protein